MRAGAALLLAILCPLAVASANAAESLVVGSKRFTESYILGEIVARVAGEHGQVRYRPGLGNTGIVFAALEAGSIDIYPDYTGTLAAEILKLDAGASLVEIDRRLAVMGLGVGVPLGFENGYVLAMQEDRAQALGIRKLSDLARHPKLRLGLSQEFIARADGWAALKRAYRLTPVTPTGIDHGLAYEAMGNGSIDVMDVYSTDAKLERFRLKTLEDDRRAFPRYDAVLVFRRDVPQRFPDAWQAISRLEGRIHAATMVRMNAAVELEGGTFAAAAEEFVPAGRAISSSGKRGSLRDVLFDGDFWRLTREHLVLVFVSLAVSVLIGIPLGVLAAKRPTLGQAVLAGVGVVQTVPSIALLAFLIAALGTIGTLPALVALALYALLPIVRNTHAGVAGIRPGLKQAALALGLSIRDRLLSIELPLAAPSIMAGIKTSAVINVGTATIAAFIGAGGYGERIVQGLALNDRTLLLAGAIPAAALALLLQGAFDLAERRLFPRIASGT
jgi:osmoprotectant transport system permease protein